MYQSLVDKVNPLPLRGTRDVLFISPHAPWYFTLTFVPRSRGSKGKSRGRNHVLIATSRWLAPGGGAPR
uniref:Uncharacterized protein n=1 Tax=uncultured marine crenarchaeote HF4000_APKG10I20 TaxID=455612 RepID=B3TCE0_9ARCH|nr:hypothetical protein ALOHA_HF4000APKG10I20ctg7g36 [uncultured marine crenarchaeote HF4000_APKG10I20]